MCLCVVKWLDRIGSFVDTAGVDLAPQCWLCLFHLHSSYAQKGQNSRGWQAEGQRRDKRLSFIASVHFSWFSKQSQCLQEVNNFRLSGFVHFLFLAESVLCFLWFKCESFLCFISKTDHFVLWRQSLRGLRYTRQRSGPLQFARSEEWRRLNQRSNGEVNGHRHLPVQSEEGPWCPQQENAAACYGYVGRSH